MGNLAAMTHGSCMVYPSEAFDPDAALLAAANENCTALYGVPTMFIAALGVRASHLIHAHARVASTACCMCEDHVDTCSRVHVACVLSASASPSRR